jgi:hypothetical protein
MTDQKQNETVLKGGFDDADELDLLNSKFFKPETNIRYELTFAPVGDVLQGQPEQGYEMVEKEVPDFNDKTKLTKRVVLKLKVSSINGKKVEQEWGVMAQKLRTLFKEACISGNILKKKYAFKSQGEGREKTYSLTEIGDR